MFVREFWDISKIFNYFTSYGKFIFDFLFINPSLKLNGSAVMDGSSRMKERPIGDLLDALRLQKTVQIDFLEKENCIPFKITSQGFYGGEIKIKSKVSSQFVSSILMSAPYAQNPVKLILEDVKQDDKVDQIY